MSVNDYVKLFNDEVQRIVDKHAPFKSRTRRINRNDCQWLSAKAREAKRRCRRTERCYRRSQSAADKRAFQAARANARTAITHSRTVAIKQRFDKASGDVAATWHVVRDVLHRDQSTATASVRRWRLGSASSSSTNWRAFVSPSPPACCSPAISLHCSSAHRTDAVLAGPHVCTGSTQAADIEACQVVTGRCAAVSPAAVVCRCLCADHSTHG